MKSIYVQDLKKSDILTQELFAVQNVERMQTKDGKPFYRLFLSDKTGTVVAQVWADAIPYIEKGALVKGGIIMIDAKAEEFKGALQLNISKANKVDEQYVDQFIEGSTFDLKDLWAELEKYMAQIKSQDIKDFLTKLFSEPETKSRYMHYPAAEYIHHGFQGGLLEHVVEMLDISMPLRKYYPEANYDLIIAGIILHDIGKIYELERVGVTIQRTVEGYLIGHLIKSYEVLVEKGTGILTPNNLLNLKHIILSHHGEYEFGSPVKPATVEAMIVCKIDLLSSQTRSIVRVATTKAADDLGFTEFDRIIGAKVFTGNIDEKKSQAELL